MKMIKTAALVALCSVGYSFAEKELVSIDSFAIMQKSKEGKEVMTSIQSDITKFQTEVQNAQKAIATEQENLEKQAKALSKEALQEKTEKLANLRKKNERKFTDEEEQLRVSIQRRQMTLRERQLKTVNEIAEKENWGAVLDKNSPGLLCVSPAIDRTDKVLAAVDAKYAAPKPKNDAVVVAAKDTKTAPKQTVKTA